MFFKFDLLAEPSVFFIGAFYGLGGTNDFDLALGRGSCGFWILATLKSATKDFATVMKVE